MGFRGGFHLDALLESSKICGTYWQELDVRST